MNDTPIRITRGPGGEVEAEGPIDAFAASILERAGFLALPALYGTWFRLPFDRGRQWENEHAAFAARMLAAARYPIALDAGLLPNTPPAAGTHPNSPPRPPRQPRPAPRR
ncbi:hypothetical protein ACFU99_12060 [Streptomyces sp. NPDC057654]|uniref:hypothetical protein n=1 Tax=Streptomyces sp. NPDC057654 TaxID=3346196 RepID=UPI0036B80C1F